MGLLVLLGSMLLLALDPADGNGNQSQVSFEGPSGTPGLHLEKVAVLLMYHSEAGLKCPQMFQPHRPSEV